MSTLKDQYHGSLKRRRILQYVASAKGVMGLYFILVIIKWYEYGYTAFYNGYELLGKYNTALCRFAVVIRYGIFPALKYVLIAFILDFLFWPYMKDES